MEQAAISSASATQMLEMGLNSLGGFVGERRANVTPITWVVNKPFYDMAKNEGWDMSRFVIAKDFPNEAVNKNNE